MADHGLLDDDVSGQALDQRFQSYQEQGLWYYRAVREATRERVAVSGLNVRTLVGNR